MQYEPTWESVGRHPVPAWFHDAKLGIFVHWGLYSVPGWAPLTGELTEVVAKEGWPNWFARNPYAEWYLNSIRIQGSPSYQYHIQTYGQDFSYDDFVPLFDQATQQWNPDDWATLFQKVGARYVVLTTKHHDGFLLWPSRQPNPKKEKYLASRDLVGELTRAVRARGLRMGLYYSGGLDWTFNQTVIKDIADLFTGVPQQMDYVEYATRHWQELIERYEPAVLWNDIAYPAAANLPELFAAYYNKITDGLVNDRFTQRFEFDPASSAIANLDHFDFKTPEYNSFDTITEFKWEATRGIGYSFGYNRNEGPENYLSLPDLVHSFVDVVSKNGNLLLNIGPMADGTIPDLQRERLLGLGRWLETNGEAIFDTRPWVRAEGQTTAGDSVRFTQKAGTIYAIVLDTVKHNRITIRSLQVDRTATIHLLGHDQALSWEQDGENLTLALPSDLPKEILASPAYAFRIAPRR
jgi:alpha-L-fucosidase